MNIEFFDGFPHAELAGRMRGLLASARRIDAAIAFVTRRGTAVLRELLERPNPPDARLLSSVRFPTDLDELRKLEHRLPGQVWIHTGYQRPYEEHADRGQFHSKLVLAELEGDERVVIVGSHNWTKSALEGDNLEAGVIFRCHEQDDLVQKARQHIKDCIAESQPFDPKDMRFYQTVQRDLHINLAAGDSANFPRFEQFQALVIHAEDATPNGAPTDLQLFVPARDRHTASFFLNDRRVQLFLYPRGSLHGQQPPSAQGVLYDGTVTMVNATWDDPVGQRPANCQVSDLLRPVLQALPGNVPAPSGEVSQIIARLERKGPEDLPIYHSLAEWPKLKLAAN